ncbi:Rec8 like protein-domain-containing protein [Crassisporium funariophilum]|nr:Rec8 like protein-domain-containing protein [Crassisporium funariophilum]
MFYSETILSRRGPLGRVWLAAHMERKLSKSQTLQTDIEQSVDAIMGQEIELMALRLSGQLLLGVVRIYSRKAKYLLDDCNEALLKIKMAFRPGVVDLTEDQLMVNTVSITLQPNGLGLDLLMPDVNWDMDFEDRPLQRQGHHQAHIDDITLRTADDFQQFDVNDPFDIGPSDGIGSQDFNDVDLGIHWGDEEGNGLDQNDKSDMMSVDESVGVGRDAVNNRLSLDYDLLGGHGLDAGQDALSYRSKSRDFSEQPFGAAMDIDTFPEVDLGDLGIGFDDLPLDNMERTPGQTRASSRASSPLTEPPVTPPPDAAEEIDLINQAHLDKSKKRHKDKKQIIDSVTEIQNGLSGHLNRRRGAANANPLNTDIGSITTEQHYLPRSSIVMRLLEIRDDPIMHFLPTQVTAKGTFFSAAPPGLTPELAELFMRPIQNSSAQKRKAVSPTSSPSKRLRQDSEVEQARRAGDVPQTPILDNGNFDRNTPGLDVGFEFADQSGAMDDYQLDVPAVDLDMGGERGKSVATDRSRLSSLGPDGMMEDGDHVFADATCPIAMFDVSQSSQQQTQSADVDQDQPEVFEHDRHGYSKNTMKALGLIRRELQPGAEEDAQDKSLSFAKASHKASRRAAASFFFELLVLGTRDCVHLTQEAPFKNIDVSAKPRLWEHQHLAQATPKAGRPAFTPSRSVSVARSLTVSMDS